MPFSRLDTAAVARSLSQIAEQPEDVVDAFFERREEVEVAPEGDPGSLRVWRGGGGGAGPGGGGGPRAGVAGGGVRRAPGARRAHLAGVAGRRRAASLRRVAAPGGARLLRRHLSGAGAGGRPA